MINTGLSGPYRLTFDAIDAAITQRAPGVFALGHADSGGRFCVNHVGRSDGDIKVRLRDFIGSDSPVQVRLLPVVGGGIPKRVRAIPRCQAAPQSGPSRAAERH